MRAIWATLALVLVSPTLHAECRPLEVPFVTDTLTTAIALGTHVATEANPIGFAGATAAKVVYYLGSSSALTEQEQKKLDHFVASATWAATVNNLLILGFAAAPIIAVPVGILAGVIYYTTQETCRYFKPTAAETESDPDSSEKPHSTPNSSAESK
jgi:hypothetical protein